MTTDPEPASDETLLERTGSGDEAAFAELYRRLAPRLYGYLRRMLWAEGDRQDVLQEVFLQIWHRATDYRREKSAAFTWAVLITRGRAIDRMRKLQRIERLSDRLEHESPPEISVPEPSEDASYAEQKELIRSALDSIEPENRQPIELAFFKGCTQQEIAEQLQQPLGTIKARIRRGLLKLRKQLLTKS